MGAGTTIGAILFAFWGERLYKAKPSRMPIMVGFGILAGIIPVMFAINLPISNPSVYYVLAFIAGLLVSTASANVKAILMNVNHPERRGSVFAVFNITDNLGQGFGPAIGGVMMAMTSTIFALNFAALWWIPCGLLFLLIAKTLGADRDALLKDLEARAELILETTSAPY
jgi:MFS family permease